MLPGGFIVIAICVTMAVIISNIFCLPIAVTSGLTIGFVVGWCVIVS